MDANAFWQEHRRFTLAVGGAVVLFAAGWAAIGAFFGDELALQRRRLQSLRSELEQPLHSSSDLAELQADNRALEAAFGELRLRVEFVPREGFALRADDAPSSRYFGVVSDLRDDLTTRCGRAGLAFPDDLGLPKLAPTREQEIARYLEALDVVERVLGLAIDSGLERLDRLQIELDPRVASNRPIEGLEKTTIEWRFTGPAPPMAALLARLQAEGDGPAAGGALVERAELSASRAGSDAARLDLVLAVAHLHGMGVEAGLEGGDG